MAEHLHSFEVPQNDSLTYDEEIDDLFNEIVGRIKTGETVLYARVEDSTVVDVFKYKKYQGCIQLIDTESSLYRAFRSDPSRPELDHECITSIPVTFEEATRAILSAIVEE